jgi:hypothetical protein
MSINTKHSDKHSDKHSSKNSDKSIDKYIDNYKNKLESFFEDYKKLSLNELKDMFKGVVIMFIKDVVNLYNKLLGSMPELKFSKSSEKITNLNTLLNALEGDGKLFGIDCNDIILRAYVNYFYTEHRDIMMAWEIDKIKSINENDIKGAVINTATKENVVETASEHLNIIPEIVLMLNNLKDKEILKILYLLNNINTLLDVYLVKLST